jgi:N-acetylmuramoyl-L-alanine amidase
VTFSASGHLVFCFAALLAAPVLAQQHESPAIPPPIRNLVVLDPAHGGADNGAHLIDNLLEKDLNLALAGRLKATLTAHGLQVITTRDGDTSPTSDQRAELANHARPVVCVLIHASNSGSGAYLAASSLTPTGDEHIALPWDTAQSAYVSDSTTLLDLASKAFSSGKVPAITLRSSVPPIDSMTCPALLLELAPMGKTAITDIDYQQSVADALTTAILAFRDQTDAAVKTAAPDTAAPVAKPKTPKPVAPKAPGAAK